MMHNVPWGCFEINGCQSDGEWLEGINGKANLKLRDWKDLE